MIVAESFTVKVCAVEIAGVALTTTDSLAALQTPVVASVFGELPL